MTQTSIVCEILSHPNTGLLSYLNQQLQTDRFSHFKSQFSFHVNEYSTQVTPNNDFLDLQTILLLDLKLSILVDNQTPPEEATLHALEFQELLDFQIIKWSHQHSQLLQPISEIRGTLSQLSEIPYHGGYLPGFEIHRQFTIAYSAGAVSNQADQLTKQQAASKYSPGDRTPVSGQYELINPDGKGTGLEVTSTAGHPFPPTNQPNQSYKLVDPTKHKNNA